MKSLVLTLVHASVLIALDIAVFEGLGLYLLREALEGFAFRTRSQPIYSLPLRKAHENPDVALCGLAHESPMCTMRGPVAPA